MLSSGLVCPLKSTTTAHSSPKTQTHWIKSARNDLELCSELEFYSPKELDIVEKTISSILSLDPRSQHSKTKHGDDALYGMRFDRLNVVFRVFPSKKMMFVVRVEYHLGNIDSNHGYMALNSSLWFEEQKTFLGTSGRGKEVVVMLEKLSKV